MKSLSLNNRRNGKSKTHQQGDPAGLVGATLPQSTNGYHPTAGIIFIAGYTGGMAPDLDHDQGKSLRFISLDDHRCSNSHHLEFHDLQSSMVQCLCI